MANVRISCWNLSIVFFKPIQVSLGDAQRFRENREDAVARSSDERGSLTPPGNDPGGMDFLASQPLDDLLTDLSQSDTIFRQGWMAFHNFENIALSRIGIHPEQEIGRGEMKKAERVRLENRSEDQNAPEIERCFGGYGTAMI